MIRRLLLTGILAVAACLGVQRPAHAVATTWTLNPALSTVTFGGSLRIYDMMTTDFTAPVWGFAGQADTASLVTTWSNTIASDFDPVSGSFQYTGVLDPNTQTYVDDDTLSADVNGVYQFADGEGGEPAPPPINGNYGWIIDTDAAAAPDPGLGTLQGVFENFGIQLASGSLSGTGSMANWTYTAQPVNVGINGGSSIDYRTGGFMTAVFGILGAPAPFGALNVITSGGTFPPDLNRDQVTVENQPLDFAIANVGGDNYELTLPINVNLGLQGVDTGIGIFIDLNLTLVGTYFATATVVVPEPSSVALLSLGVAGFAGVGLRRRFRKTPANG